MKIEIDEVTTKWSNGYPIEINIGNFKDHRKPNGTKKILRGIAEAAHKEIEKLNLKERIHNIDDSEELSLAGHTCEIVHLVATAINRKFALQEWNKTLTRGRNYGKDVLPKCYGFLVNRPTEVKCTASCFTDKHGILFMRTPAYSGCKRGDQNPSIEFWMEHLPDSYYCLWQQLCKADPFHFRFRGWATKDMFFKYHGKSWEKYNATMRHTIDTFYNGYPIIGIHHLDLNPPESYFEIVRGSQK